MAQHQNTFYWGLGGDIAIIIIMVMINIFHLLDTVNNNITDTFGRFSPAAISAGQRSIVVECNPVESRFSNKLWLDIINNLETIGARQIIFLFIPENVNESFFKSISQNQSVYLTNTGFLKQLSSENSIVQYERLFFLQAAPIYIPPPENGIYRKQYTYLHSNDKGQLPHLVRITAGRLTDLSSLEKETFQVNFIGRKVESQPRVNLSLVTSGNQLESLIKGKTVFITQKNDAPFTGLITPLTRKDELISPAVYTAYSYDTLVNRKELYSCGFIISLIIFSIFIISGSVVTQYMRVGPALISAIFSILLTIILTWIFLAFFQILLPVSELFVGQSLLIILIITGKSTLSEDKISAVAFETRQKVQERLLPADIYNSQQYWLQVVGMVSQLLNLDRSIFLEKIPDDTRVREVAAANTSIEDISERRRDYTRFPYTEALAENGAVEVKNYLSSSEIKEYQYLAPLKITDSDVLGFWACSISVEQKKLLPDLISMINTFAIQISEMLYAREQWQDEQKIIQNPLRKLMALEAGTEKSEEINSAFSLLSKRLSTLEKVFDSLGTGAVLYDLFGQVIYANQKIVALCREIDASPYKLSGAELVSLLSGQLIHNVKQTLTDLIFSGEIVNFYTGELGEKHHSYLLKVKAIRDNTGIQKSVSEEPINALNVMGILLEIHEVSNIQKIMKQKEAYFSYSNRAFRAYEISFPPVFSELRNRQISNEMREKLIVFLEKRTQSLFEFINQLKKVMDQDMLDIDMQYFPTESIECLNTAISQLSGEITAKKIDFNIQKPDNLFPILAIPEELEKIFSNIIFYLINDAVPGSTISIDIHREGKFIIYHLNNRGYGMPDHDFHGYLSGDETTLSPEFRALFAAKNQIEEYRGHFEARSQLGKGTKINVKLKRF